MGLTGNYIAVEEKELKKIKKGKADLFALTGEDGRLACDIDKAWDMLNITLTGEHFDGDPPAGYVVPMIRERLIDGYADEFNAYLLSAQQVKEAAAYLAELTEEKFRSLYDHDELVDNEVYGMVDGGAEFEFGYITEYLAVLKDFYKKAAGANKAVVFWVC